MDTPMITYIKRYCFYKRVVTKQMIQDVFNISNLMANTYFVKLVKQGILRKIDRLNYMYIRKSERIIWSGKDKLWRAFKISNNFTVAKIERLSGYSKPLIYRVIEKYLKEGFIRRAGVEKILKNGSVVQIYRLAPLGKKYNSREEIENEYFENDKFCDLAMKIEQMIMPGVFEQGAEQMEKTIELTQTLLNELQELKKGEVKQDEKAV